MDSVSDDRRAESDVQSVVSTFLERLADADADGLAELFAETVDWMVPGDPALPWTGRRTRRAEIGPYFRTLWSHLEAGASRVELERIVVDGNDALLLLSFSHVAGATGRRFTTAAAIRLTVDAHRIIRLHLYEDTWAVSQAWVPPPTDPEGDLRVDDLKAAVRGAGSKSRFIAPAGTVTAARGA